MMLTPIIFFNQYRKRICQYFCYPVQALYICFLFTLIPSISTASPPHPDIQEKISAGKIAKPYFIENIEKLHAQGMCAGFNPYVKSVSAKALDNSPQFTGDFKALAILVEFSDHPKSVTGSFFDSLIFDSVGNTVRNYYDEISYGQFRLVSSDLPSSVDWVMAPETYTYYVDGQNGTGTYPNNCQKLVEDLVDLVDPDVDFSEYDNDGDGLVDLLMIVHSGVGAEYAGGSSDDIWSHQYAISPREKDGVYISTYTIQAEYCSTPGDQTIGVMAHELGHVFGLPDLYDTDYSSNGIGRWGLMSFGTWNGPSGRGESPAHPCAWSRIEMGFASPVNVVDTMYDVPISNVEESGEIYRFRVSDFDSDEYFLIENRQKILNDASLPSEGLLIWHIDDFKPTNRYEWWPESFNTSHYKVALEQADGLYELEKKINYGNNGDPFPGSNNNTSFNANSTPNSDSYDNEPAPVGIVNIRKDNGIILADLLSTSPQLSSGSVNNLPQNLDLSQNYPNPFNPTTIIEFSIDYSTRVKLEILNIQGQIIRTLLDEQLQPCTKTIIWDGKDDSSRDAASGVYFYRVSAGSNRHAKKMIMVR